MVVEKEVVHRFESPGKCADCLSIFSFVQFLKFISESSFLHNLPVLLVGRSCLSFGKRLDEKQVAGELYLDRFGFVRYCREDLLLIVI